VRPRLPAWPTDAALTFTGVDVRADDGCRDVVAALESPSPATFDTVWQAWRAANESTWRVASAASRACVASGRSTEIDTDLVLSRDRREVRGAVRLSSQASSE
jgi:hypothetical protein